MQTVAQLPAVARVQCAQVRANARVAAPLNAKAGKASAQRLSSVASVKAARASLQASVACRAARAPAAVSVTALSYVEPEHVAGLMARDPDVYFMDIRSEPEVRNGVRPQFDRKHYVFNPIMHSLQWGVEPNREFVPVMKDRFKGDKKETSKILIACADGGERSILAYSKLAELGYKVKIVRGGYEAYVAARGMGAAPPAY